jgi:hypothetical protein
MRQSAAAQDWLMLRHSSKRRSKTGRSCKANGGKWLDHNGTFIRYTDTRIIIIARFVTNYEQFGKGIEKNDAFAVRIRAKTERRGERSADDLSMLNNDARL